MAPIDIALLILILIIIAIALLIAIRGSFSRIGGCPATTMREGGDRSKLEARIVHILEEITGARFDQAHPKWLHGFELDGYNADLAVAIEVQGPGHTKPMPGESYEKYQKRIERDALKRKICESKGVRLITVDYRISLVNVGSYLRSRLWDMKIFERIPKFPEEKPYNYIKEIDMVPWVRGAA